MAEEADEVAQAAAARRERLNVLRTAKELLSAPDDDAVQTSSKEEVAEKNKEDQSLNLKFRNYLPRDKQLQEVKVAPPVLLKFEEPVNALPQPLEEVEDPFLNIAPKKPNWDLKRDVQKKLDKLEKRTQKAIFKLMEEQDAQRQATAAENDPVAAT